MSLQLKDTKVRIKIYIFSQIKFHGQTLLLAAFWSRRWI